MSTLGGAKNGRDRADGTVRPPEGRTVFVGEEAVRPLKISELVARDIVRDIVSGGLVTGDRLALKADMGEQYGVSRESLREGLRLLEVQGLVTLRRGPGGGPVVGRVDPANFGRMSSLFYHLAGGTYEELFEAWVVTEATLAKRAARNQDRARVVEAMEPFMVTAEHRGGSWGLEEFIHAHSYFHAVVASLAGNRVLELMLQTIGQIVTHHIAVNADPRDAESEIDRAHIDAARAISRGQPLKARSVMADHIRLLIEFYKDRAGELTEFIDWK